MARRRRIALAAASAALAVGSLAVAGCGSDSSSSDTSGGDAGAALSGKIVIDGSSTVAPLTSGAVEAFTADGGGGDVNITVGTSGTGGGFELFCAGETDISDASRGKLPSMTSTMNSGPPRQVLRPDRIHVATPVDVAMTRRPNHATHAHVSVRAIPRPIVPRPRMSRPRLYHDRILRHLSRSVNADVERLHGQRRR